MGIWRLWRKKKYRQNQDKADQPGEDTQRDARVEWEFGENDLPLDRKLAANSRHRDGLARTEHAGQRHGSALHRYPFVPRSSHQEETPPGANAGNGNAPASKPSASPPSQTAASAPSATPSSAAPPSSTAPSSVRKSRSVDISSIEMPPSYDATSYGATSDDAPSSFSPTSLPSQVASNNPHEDWALGDDAELRDAFRSVGADARVRSVRQSLELALDEWWSQQKLLSPPLLRNGLLVLEAGHKLDEAYLSLLLRSALRLRRGMLTALRHQTDPDRAAYLLKEALLYEPAPLPTETLWRLRRDDEESGDWVELLHYDLEQDSQTLIGERQQLALAAMRQLESDDLLVDESAAVARPRLYMRVTPHLWSVGRALIVLLLFCTLLTTVAWNQRRSRLDDMVLIPAGTYTVNNERNGTRSVNIPTLSMDRTEVTNRSYRLCYEQGKCSLPQSVDSATRAGYFFDPAFDFYPVVNIDWESANQYCAWAGKRLPTLAEWEVAASVAPATERLYTYPWGDVFQRQYANSQLTGIGDTQRVGLYHPLGSSSFGVADMAGNVAEWTLSLSDVAPADADTEADERVAHVVKGGSYRNGPPGLRADTHVPIDAQTARPWLGFRCVAAISGDMQRAISKY